MRRSTVVFILAGLCLLGVAVVTRDYDDGATTLPPPTVTANPTSITAGGSVMVSWNWPSWGPSREDWIGIYVPGTEINSVVNSMYNSSCTQEAPGAKAKASGSCSFTVPTTPGTYQFRLFTGSTLMATSGNITVTASGPTVTARRPTVTTNVSSVSTGGSVTVSWSGVSFPVPRDWLGLYTPRAPNRAYVNWKYDSSCTQTAGATATSSGSCSFTMPTTAGTYQFRLLANDGYALIATSPNLTVS